jgi:hypothetical protein
MVRSIGEVGPAIPQRQLQDTKVVVLPDLAVRREGAEIAGVAIVSSEDELADLGGVVAVPVGSSLR